MRSCASVIRGSSSSTTSPRCAIGAPVSALPTRGCGTISRGCDSRRCAATHARQVIRTKQRLAEEAFEVFYRARNEVQLYDDVLPGARAAARARPPVRAEQRQCGSRPGRARRTVRTRARGPRRRNAQARPADLPPVAAGRRPRARRGRARRRRPGSRRAGCQGRGTDGGVGQPQPASRGRMRRPRRRCQCAHSRSYRRCSGSDRSLAVRHQREEDYH